MAVESLFKLARHANLLRHARRGTLATHLARKSWIWRILKRFPFTG